MENRNFKHGDLVASRDKEREESRISEVFEIPCVDEGNANTVRQGFINLYYYYPK